MGKKSSSAGDKVRFGAYKALDRAKANAKRRVERHLKKHPEDKQAQAALAAVGSRTYRTKPNVKGGWVKESLRATMMFVPYLNSKGTAIPLRFPEQLDYILRSHGQSIPLTKTNTRGFAQLVKFTATSAFRPIPVTVTKKVDGYEVSDVVWKHTSKLSNYTE